MKFKLVLISFLILDIFLLALWMSGNKTEYPGVDVFSGKNMSFTQLKSFFSDLAWKKGANYAYEVLKKANLPPNTDLHLLGHVVGDVLYKQQGAEGIKICTEDFRNACSHSIVVGFFIDKGDSALSEIQKACKKAPGGLGAYTMCFHGLGHGILAYKQYDLPKAIEICKKTGTQEHGNQESSQCISGTVMEIISGGGHDKNLWSKQRKKYLFADNPFYLCSNSFVPKEAKTLCYAYITPYLWEAVGADLGRPTDEDFKKSFALCNQMPEEDKAYIDTCFGGFGKEFVGLAVSRDIRRVDQMNDTQLTTIYNWCQLTEDSAGIMACLNQALSSLYWGGENDRNASIRFCNVISDQENKRNCFINLIGQVSAFIKDSKYRHSFCQEIPVQFNNECKRVLDN